MLQTYISDYNALIPYATAGDTNYWTLLLDGYQANNNNTIPNNRIDAIGAAVAALYPQPNQPGDPLLETNNFRTNVLTPLHRARLVEFDRDTNSVLLSPSGATETETKVLPKIKVSDH